MDLPWPQIAFISTAGSAGLRQFAPQYSLSRSYLATFFILFAILSVLGAFWKVILWPKLFSPLRHLPQPPVSCNGQMSLTVH